jgi:hypothetical protein
MIGPQHNFVPVVTTIEFDDVPSGTAIDNHYQGITFRVVRSNFSVPSRVYAISSGYARTAPNTVSVNPSDAFFNRTSGGIEVTFDPLVFGVSIYVRGWRTTEPMQVNPADNRPFIEAFDGDTHLLVEAKYPYTWFDPNFGEWQNLVVTSGNSFGEIFTPKIKSVIFSCQQNGYPHVWAAFDTLRFWRYEFL